MHLEIERRFLATPAALTWCRAGTDIVQGYLRADGRFTVRVRIASDIAIMTFKGRRSGYSRFEHEKQIPLSRARALLAEIPPHMKVCKTRYVTEHDGLSWEIDVFTDLNAGLILAEVEIDDPHHLITPPSWVADEVTHDSRYSNSHLARCPYSQWSLAA